MSVASLTTLLMVCFPVGSDSDRSPVKIDTDVELEVVADELPHKWMTSYDDARELATKHKLPLLLHFDATWCGACRRMEAEVMSTAAVTDQLGSTVVGVRIDADRYKNLIAEYEITTLPTEVVVQPDGSRSKPFVGAVSFNTYVSRLKQIGVASATAVANAASEADSKDAAEVRSCLIVKRDGKMVGAGGYSPVALVSERRWLKGSDKFVATHEGVDYFLQSQQEVDLFKADPAKYIPLLHGLDLVELHLEKKKKPGAIEYGYFYKGHLYFFATMKNRDRFENNPTWYLAAIDKVGHAEGDMLPLINAGAVEN